MVVIRINPELVEEGVEPIQVPEVGVAGQALGSMTARTGAGCEGAVFHSAAPLEHRKTVVVEATQGLEGVAYALQEELTAGVCYREVHHMAPGAKLVVVPGAVGVGDVTDLPAETRGEVAHVLTQDEKPLGSVGPMRGPGFTTPSVAYHAQVGPVRDVDGGSELAIESRAVRGMADHAGDGAKLAVPLFQVLGVHPEGLLQGSLAFVAGGTGTPATGVVHVGASAVGRLGPLLDEGMVTSIVTFPTAVLCVDAGLERGQRLLGAGG
jgi:hypothetical protein